MKSQAKILTLVGMTGGRSLSAAPESKSSLWLGLIVASFIFFSASFAVAQVTVQVSRIGDATHFEFRGAQEWNYDLKREGKDGIALRVPPLKREDIQKLKSWSDPLIKSVRIKEKSVDGAMEVYFSVAPGTDFFDYITDQPSRLIVDLFPKEPKQPVVEKAPEKKLPEKKPKAQSNPRQPAGTDLVITVKNDVPPVPTLSEQLSSRKDPQYGIFDGGDPDFKRFEIKDYEIKEDAIHKSRANFYLPFPMLDLGVPHLDAILKVPPTYEIVANDTRLNKEARLLLRLFSEKKRATFIKAAEEFLKENPDSPYDEVVRYMLADAHYDVWLASGSIKDFDLAMNQYLLLVERYPESPMTQRTLLLMGYSYLDRGDSFGALKVFERFMRMFPESKYMDRVRLSTASAYLKLNRFDEAYSLLDDIEKNGKTARGRQEAAYRKGDVFFRKKEYAEAIKQYKGALSRHAAVANEYPNAWYNTAEAEFLLGNYRKSIEDYRTFLRRFPNHEYGGYAMTRIGELFGIFGADKERAMGAFRESFFRYRSTPGAGIARIHMLVEKMPQMKEKELKSAVQEIQEITNRYSDRSANDESVELTRLVPKEGDVPAYRKLVLPGIEEFSVLEIADGFSARKDYDTAARELITFIQKNPSTPNKDRFVARIVNNISDEIGAAVDRGDFMGALDRYAKNAPLWLKDSKRVDVCYNVGRAYELAGVFREAAKVYEDCLKLSIAVKNKPSEIQRDTVGRLPSADAIRLRIAAVEAKSGRYAEAESVLKKISKNADLSEKQRIERAEISAEIAEARGQAKAALHYLADLIQHWKGDKKLTSPLHLRVARLQLEAGDLKNASEHLEKIVAWKKEDPTSVSDDVHASALETLGDVLVKRGKRTEAASAYRELLETYESARPLASVRYRLGQILYQDGDLKGAETVWNGLNTGDDNIWWKLATEQIESAKWQEEYKKYLERIPAAAELRRQ